MEPTGSDMKVPTGNGVNKPEKVDETNRRIPAVTVEEMREVDRRAVEDFGVELAQMMENAGRHLASLARRVLHTAEGKSVSVLVGKGNNGGGVVAARHLSTWGDEVAVILSRDPDELGSTAGRQLETVREMGLLILRPSDPGFLGRARKLMERCDLVLDALIGYGLTGSPRGTAASLIRTANEVSTPILALDVPSGLDATSGEVGRPCIQASWTLTLALPKTGLLKTDVERVVGELFLADIGIPRQVYEELGIEGVFRGGDLVRIRERTGEPVVR
ncbi:MAG: NAD(P)H-hydrate epimerase [Candidatus Geothermarchaeales archaeon]